MAQKENEAVPPVEIIMKKSRLRFTNEKDWFSYWNMISTRRMEAFTLIKEDGKVADKNFCHHPRQKNLLEKKPQL